MDRSRAKLLAEFSVPSFIIGGVAWLAAGGMALVIGESLGWAAVSGLGLGVPIGLIGGLYSVLVARKKVPVGVFAPACIYWLVGFPVAMLTHELVLAWIVTGAPALPAEPLWQFLAYNALLSMGFAIGFLWAHECLGRRWWPKIMDHNPYAAACVAEYVTLAVSLQEREDARERSRAVRRGPNARAK